MPTPTYTIGPIGVIRSELTTREAPVVDIKAVLARSDDR